MPLVRLSVKEPNSERRSLIGDCVHQSLVEIEALLELV